MERKDCPKCLIECTSNHIQNGVYSYWCDYCKYPFEGDYVVDDVGFASDPRFNDV